MFVIGQPSKNAVMVVNMSAWCGRKSRIEWIAADDTFWEDGRIHFTKANFFFIFKLIEMTIDIDTAQYYRVVQYQVSHINRYLALALVPVPGVL